MQAEIVIPCFNEASNLKDLFNECCDVIEASDYTLGFILVNNGSTDDSKIIFDSYVGRNPNLKIIELAENKGYGGGILAGLKLTHAQIIGWTHADLQTPLLDCLSGVYEIQGKIAFVKGSRKGRSFTDALFSRGMGIFESILFHRKLEEINAQPTIFMRDFYELWSNPPLDFSLDLYALVMATETKVPIRRRTVQFLPRQYGESKWNLGFRSRIRFIKRTIKYSLELRKKLDENL